MKYLQPWVVSPQAIKDQPNIAEVWGMINKDVLILEPRITQDMKNHLPSDIAALYKPIFAAPKAEAGDGVLIDQYTDEPVSAPHAFWLDIAQCPPSERVRWKFVPHKANLVEAASLLEYLELFHFTGQNDTETFRLRDAHKAWAAP